MQLVIFLNQMKTSTLYCNLHVYTVPLWLIWVGCKRYFILTESFQTTPNWATISGGSIQKQFAVVVVFMFTTGLDQTSSNHIAV